jgi:hypothetical protein
MAIFGPFVSLIEIILTCGRINEIQYIVFEEMPAYNGGLTFVHVCITASPWCKSVFPTVK